MTHTEAPDPSAPTNSKLNNADPAAPVRREQLASVFEEYHKPPEQFRIGAESEKFGVHRETGRPLGYGEEFGVCKVLDYLAEAHGWEPYREHDGGPVVALKRAGASITLEPGGQLELSGAPLANLHQIWAEERAHLAELRPITERLQVAWLASGFHPLARPEELPWVPKRRYPIMRQYLPTRGSGGIDMMQRTCTVQANFDWSTERDGMTKVVTALKVSPLVHALFANSPFEEGRLSPDLSRRGRVWLHMDPSRSGLIPGLWSKAQPSYDDYVEWSLDAGMFLFVRDGQVIKNTGQSFRDFLAHGYEGHHATLADYQLHLTTLFPEVRLKSTIEVRSFDALPPRLSMAAKALWVGLLYDAPTLARLAELTAGWSAPEMLETQPQLVRLGLDAEWRGQSGWRWAEQLLDLAAQGLAARGVREAGKDESEYLKPAWQLVAHRVSPAAEARHRLEQSGSLISSTRIDLWSL